MSLDELEPIGEYVPPKYDTARVLELLRAAQPGPPPVAPRPGFLDRLGAGLANLQAPAGGRAGDEFGANLLAGAGRAFGGNRVATREAELKRQMDEYERGKALKSSEAQAQIMGLNKDYDAAVEGGREGARALAAWRKEKRERTKAEADAKTAADREGRRQFESDREYKLRVQAENRQSAKDRADAAKAGKPELKPPSAGERDKFTDDATALGQANDLRRLYRKEFVGPMTGQLQGVASKVGAPASLIGIKLRPGEADFRGALAQYRNRVINALSGAAVSESEARRMAEQIPQETDPSETFEAKLRQTEQNLRNVASTRRTTATSTGVDLSGLAPLPGSDEMVRMRDPYGRIRRVPVADVQAAEAQGGVRVP